MEKNATVMCNLKGLLDALDAKSYAIVIELGEDGKQKKIAEGRVYKLMVDMLVTTNYLYKAKRYAVIGLSIDITGTSILIKKGEY